MSWGPRGIGRQRRRRRDRLVGEDRPFGQDRADRLADLLRGERTVRPWRHRRGLQQGLGVRRVERLDQRLEARQHVGRRRRELEHLATVRHQQSPWRRDRRTSATGGFASTRISCSRPSSCFAASSGQYASRSTAGRPAPRSSRGALRSANSFAPVAAAIRAAADEATPTAGLVRRGECRSAGCSEAPSPRPRRRPPETAVARPAAMAPRLRHRPAMTRRRARSASPPDPGGRWRPRSPRPRRGRALRRSATSAPTSRRCARSSRCRTAAGGRAARGRWRDRRRC